MYNENAMAKQDSCLLERRMDRRQFELINHLKEQTGPCDLLFRHLEQGVLLLNNEKKVVYINPFMSRVLASSQERVFNQFLTQFLYPDDIPAYLKQLETLQKTTKKSLELDCRFISPERESSWWRMTLSTLAVPSLSGSHYLVLVRNINREREAGELLREAQKDITEANKAKTEFLSNMSHEIRTPIHTVVGMTELLLDTGLNQEQKKYVNQIRYSSDALLTLVNHILDFSRIEAGDMLISEVEFNLHRMLENIFDLVISRVNKKRLELILFIGPGVPELVTGDPPHLQQIIRNLLSNAVKFTEEGEIVLSVIRLPEAGPRVKLRFSVKDTGIGVDQNKIRYVFNSFSEEDNSFTRKYSGIGVGLSIVKKLIEHLRGEFFVDSAKGQGSDFYFDLTFQEHSDILQTERPEPRPFAGLTVMIFGNNTTSTRVLSDYIKEWGGDVKLSPLDNLLAGAEVSAKPGTVKPGAEPGMAEVPAKPGTVKPGADREFDLGIVDLTVGEVDKILAVAARREERPLILLRPTGISLGKDAGDILGRFTASVAKPVRKRVLFSSIFQAVNAESGEPDAEHSENDTVTEKIRLKTSGPDDPARVSMLVVEDHEVNREFFCTILDKMGYRVHKATDGLEAVQMIEQHTFDLIFMDIQMPGMNGYDVTRLLRDKGIKVPIIAVTANTVKGEITRCLQAGMNDYLAKPFKRSDLLPLLAKWLETERFSQEVSPAAEESRGLSVFDFEKAVEMFMGQKKVVLRLLAPFVERIAGQVAGMQEAFARGEYLPIQHEAHTIKGGALNIQAIELGTSARELEQAAREKDSGRTEAGIEQLAAAYGRFKAAVETVLRDNRKG